MWKSDLYKFNNREYTKEIIMHNTIKLTSSWNNHRFVKLPKYSFHDSQVDEKQKQLDLFLEAEISPTEVSMEKMI